MKVKFVLILTLILFFSSPLTAQDKTNIDSLLNVYKGLPNDTTKVNLIDDMFDYYVANDTSKLREYSKRQYELSKEINFQKGIGNSFLNYAKYYGKKRKEDSTVAYYEKALKIFQDINYIVGEAAVRHKMADRFRRIKGYDAGIKFILENREFYKKIKDSTYLGATYRAEANAHFFNDRYRLALDSALKALKIFKINKDSLSMVAISQTLSYIECELKNNESALEYAIKYLNSIEDSNKRAVAGMNNTMGIIYTQQKEYKKADSIFNKAYRLATETDWPYMKKLVLHNHGKSYVDRKDYDTALEKAKAYLEIEKKSPLKRISSLGSLNMGTALVKLNRAEEAKVYLDKALKAAKQENLKHRLIPTYESRTEANAKLNNYKEAFEDYKIYADLKDSVLNETKSQQIEEMRAIFDTEKKEQQIAQQETEITLLEEQEKVSDLQKILLGGGLGLSLIALGFGFYGFKQRTKRTRLEKEKIEAELDFKKKELTTHALHLAKKNEVLEGLKQKAAELKKTEGGGKAYQELITTINFDQQDDKAWENFTRYFEAVHKDFEKQAVSRYPDISKNELRLMALIKMNLSSKEIANILNISSDGVKKSRQRLRKKMNLSPEDSLETTVMSI